MDGLGLEQHWRRALETAGAAVESAALARLLSPSECHSYAALIARERRWLELVQWSSFDDFFASAPESRAPLPIAPAPTEPEGVPVAA